MDKLKRKKMATFTEKSLQGETIEALVWRVLKVSSPVVEQVIELNPNLAGQIILPENTIVILPKTFDQKPKNQSINIWD